MILQLNNNNANRRTAEKEAYLTRQLEKLTGGTVHFTPQPTAT
jgi:hypothetical protein